MPFNKWSKIAFLLWCISICIVIYLSLIPQVEFPVDFWNADKVYHCAAYAWLALLSIMSFRHRRFALSAALSMILLGVALEIGQYYVPGRSCSFADGMANSLGATTGIFLGYYVRNKSDGEKSNTN
jgi:VanZ family protein